MPHFEPASHQGLTNVWLTPKFVIDDLGPFDLDPCPAPEPRPWPTAKVHLTGDGLEQFWEGCVWLNPPYGNETRHWVRKLIRHGNGIALVASRTDTAWFYEASQRADLVFFPKGRIRFFNADGSQVNQNPTFPSVFFSFGAVATEKLMKINLEGSFFTCLRS